jgi:hypothetical protein
MNFLSFLYPREICSLGYKTSEGLVLFVRFVLWCVRFVL